MKIAKRIIILIGIVLFANYIIHLPMCVNDYVHRESGIYSAQHMCRHSTLKRNSAEQIQHIPVLIFSVIPLITHYIFDISKIFFDITHVPVYHWQLARCDLSAKSVLSY